MLDLAIVGGLVVDGTGTEPRRADVGIRDGRVVGVGTVTEAAAETIDASGLVVTPGFVDVHTHYDAQVFWESSLSPSSLHGVTTAIGGNCGFTIAPMAPAHVDYSARLLAIVEGIPLEALETGVPWGSWGSFGEYLGLLDGTMAINVGFLAGHSTIRRLVLGDECRAGSVTEAQVQAMEDVLRTCLEQGALGFSTSNGENHLDGDGQHVPSRFATDDEFFRLAGVVADFPGTTLEYIPTDAVDEGDRMIEMSRRARRPINWNVMTVTSERRSRVAAEVELGRRACAAGAEVVALTNPAPIVVRRSFLTGFGFNTLDGWAELFELPLEQRVQALCRRDVRDRMHAGAEAARERRPDLVDFGRYTVEETFSAATTGLAGRVIADIATERGVSPLETLLDIVVADDLRTTLLQAEVGADDASWQLRSELWRHPDVVLGASDAGAHLDMLTLSVYPTDLLGPSVRDRRLLSLEAAVRLLTDVPARLYGLRHRGRLAAGWHADVVVFDPNTVGPEPARTVSDLPAGASRLFAGARGVRHVIVNGTEIARDGAFTGATPGRVLRAGRDTDTVLPGQRGTSPTGRTEITNQMEA